MHPLRLLVVESNPADSYLIVEGLRQAGLSDEIVVLDNSEQAFSYLCREGPVDLIFLDLNVTPIPGLEMLERIRSHPQLQTIPVVIVSGSQNGEDISETYRRHANCFITKPNNLDEFFNHMKICYEFWAKVVTLPPPG